MIPRIIPTWHCFKQEPAKIKGARHQNPKVALFRRQACIVLQSTKQYLTLTNVECPPMQWVSCSGFPRRSHSLETRYDKEGMLGLHSPLSKGPHSTPKQYHAPAPMLSALLCNGSHAMDPPRRSHNLETRLDRGGTLSFHCQEFLR